MTSQFDNYYPIDNYSQDFNLLENFEFTKADKSDDVLAGKIINKLPSISKNNANKKAKAITIVKSTRNLIQNPTNKPIIHAVAKQIIKTVPNVTPKQAVKHAIQTLKTPEIRSKKIRTPHSSHVNYTEQDILDVSRWLQEKHPKKSATSIRNFAIYQLKTSRHSLEYLKGNTAARAAWVAHLTKMKLYEQTRDSSKIKSVVHNVLKSTNKPIFVTASTKAAAQKKASKVAIKSNKFIVKK